METERKLTIYLVRHVQYKGNVCMSQQKILNLDTADMLTIRGKTEANLLGMHLSSVKFDCIYSSDYGRAKQTAEGILRQSKASKSTPVMLDKRLREINFGKFETAEYEVILDYSMTLNKPPLEWYYPEGERMPQSGKRMLSVIEEICEKYLNSKDTNDSPSPNVVVVSHSVAILNFLNILYKSNHELVNWDPQELKFMKNANYMKIEIKNCNVKNGCSIDADSKPKWQFNFSEKYFGKHLECINTGTGSKDENPLLTFIKSRTRFQQFVGCVHQ